MQAGPRPHPASQPLKHRPFQSIYRQEFEVLEQRDGNTRLYPHTEQLPLLLRALNLEFYNALPGHIARTDKRGDGFHKILIKSAALLFCNAMNAARADQLRLYSLPNPDLVARVAIVQQVTEHTRQGPLHRFRFYAGTDFFPEIRLSGRRLVFADHVLQRFSARVPNNVGEDLSQLLLTFFGTPHIALPVGPGYAFIVTNQDTILAFPFKMDAEEFLITTCLTINEINSLGRETPPLTFNLHYGEAFTVPRVRHWLPTQWMTDLYAKWERKTPLPPPREPAPKQMTWHRLANWIQGHEEELGHGPGSQYFFLDHIPGPCGRDVLPGQPEPHVNELEIYKQKMPGNDWDGLFARREKSTVGMIEGEDQKPEAGQS
jgi:hypothetical protein